MTAQWSIQPRGADLRRSYDPVTFWSSLTVIERHNVTGTNSGTWSVTAANAGLTGLFTPANGVILTRNGDKIMSGQITEIQRGAHVSTISGFADFDLIGDKILAPDPTQPFTNQGIAYDNRTGPAETVLLAYVNANAGPGARATRQITGLALPTTQGRGATVKASGRLETVRDLVMNSAETGSLHVDVLHDESTGTPRLLMRVRPITDRTASVRFGTAKAFTGAVIGDDWSYTLTRPTVTEAVVAGGGVGASRVFNVQANTAAEAIWGARIELLVDQRDTTDATQLAQSGTDALSASSAPVNVSFTITDQPDVQYRRDWFVGDKVGVSIDGLTLDNLVREVTSTVTVTEGGATEVISAVVGSRDSSAYATKSDVTVSKALKALDLLKAT